MHFPSLPSDDLRQPQGRAFAPLGSLLLPVATDIGPSGLAAICARRARMHACRLAFGRRRPVGPEGKICWPPDGAFFRALDLENNFFGSLLLSADKYIHQLRTTPQRHKGLTKRFVAVSSLAILAGYRQQRRTAAGPRAMALRSRLVLVAAACGAGPSGVAALSSGRAGARSGLRARWSRNRAGCLTAAGIIQKRYRRYLTNWIEALISLNG
ncbi:MAG: hypothetical protein WBN94_00115 [Methanothrix sp.]